MVGYLNISLMKFQDGNLLILDLDNVVLGKKFSRSRVVVFE